MQIFSQICGVIATAFTIFALFNNDKSKILIYKCISDTIFCLQWLLLSSFLGALISLIAVIRNLTYYFLSKKERKATPFVYLFSLIIIMVGIISYKTPFDILAILGSVAYTFSFSVKDVIQLKYLTLIASGLWLIYGVFYFSIGGIISESFSILSTVISLIIIERTKNFQVRQAKRLK